MEIEVGADPTDRAALAPSGYTFISKERPCLTPGHVTKVSLWADTPLTGLKVGLFRQVGANDFTTHSWVNLGNVAAGYSQHDVDLEVDVGDYIGAHWLSGSIDMDNAGEGLWYWGGSGFPCTNQTFSLWADKTFSLYGWGPEPAPPLKYFRIVEYMREPLCVGALVQVRTLELTHLYCRITAFPPRKHMRTESGR